MSLAGKAIVSIWHDIADEGRDEFYWWHIHEHMPERVGVPGFLRGRRYIAEEGSPEFFTLYEAETLSVLSGPDYLARLNDPTPWTLTTVDHFNNVARSLQEVRYSRGSGGGGYLLSYAFDISPDAGTDGEFSNRLAANVLDSIAAERGICGVHLSRTDLDISDTPTEERERRTGGTNMPGWSLLIEAARRDDLDRVSARYLTDDAFRGIGIEGIPVCAVYRLEYVQDKPAVTL